MLDQRTETLLRRWVRRDVVGGVRKLLAKTRPEDLAAALSHMTWAEQIPAPINGSYSVRHSHRQDATRNLLSPSPSWNRLFGAPSRLAYRDEGAVTSDEAYFCTRGVQEQVLGSIGRRIGAQIPVIMGMGGNVGIQSATVAVRGLATGEIQFGGVVRFLVREAQIGVLLGIFFAVVLGLYGGLRFGVSIGSIVASSVALSIAAAAAIGGAIPLFLNRLGADPAIATGPFVTTAVDILAILIYFNISRLLLGL